jgi:hypothetical protein
MPNQLEGLLEWYKWLLKFHPLKYLGIAIMTIGPLYFIYRFIFIGSTSFELGFACAGFLVLGSFIWSLGWDPYA